jgi:hypothetical protein
MTVLQRATQISIREGFHTFLIPKTILMTTATVSANGPSILMVEMKLDVPVGVDVGKRLGVARLDTL